MPKEDTLPKRFFQLRRSSPSSLLNILHFSKLTLPKRESIVWRHLWESTSESHFPLPAPLTPSPIKPYHLFYSPHSAMPSEASHDTQQHTPCGDSSRKKPSVEGNLQEVMERLRASMAKMTENYEHLRTKNVELEHDCRALKCNWERTHP
ncbi:unnamed protein product [Prunus brigantina]